MASTSSPHQQNAFLGIEPPNKRRKVEQSSRLFDVFINHRGPDVKQTLATQLYNSLQQLGIRAFLDSQEKELGTSFPSTIETAISSASVHIAIFSKGYAHSAWCLAELVLMLQSKAKIIPLFYQVKPWELRHIEKGVYAGAFLKYKEKGRYMEKINEWKEALQSVSFTTGYEFNLSDSIDCKEIVSAVEKEVRRTKHLHVAKHPVGLHKLVKDFERQCLRGLVQDFKSRCGMNRAGKEKANIVGIFGMGGVGKTTLSKELFNQKKSKYTRASFLFDVREASSRAELSKLQSTLLKDLFSEDHRFQSLEEGTSCLRDRWERSGSLSFLIVLDDIDHVEQLDALIAMDILNKYGNHLVIITTRDVGVLVTAGIEIAYHLKGLDREDAKELFCWHAFRQPQPCSGYEDLVEKFVKKCGCLPLSLHVLGRHVYGKDPRYWKQELEKVSKTLPGDVKKRLKISFDSLEYEEQQIFMDVACFFIDKSKSMAMTIWEGSGWRPHRALETLKDKCLLEEVEKCHRPFVDWKWSTVRDRFAFRMHDHLRDLGREMANELSHPRRLWHPQHLKSFELQGFQNILAQTKGRSFHSIWDESMGCQITYFIVETEDSSDTSLLWLQLRYMQRAQLLLNSDINPSIPSWIPLQNLQCLRINGGRFQRLWQSDMQAPSRLKELRIGRTFLQVLPDLSGKSDNMEDVVLDAKEFQMDIWSLLGCLGMNLRSLSLMGSRLTGDLASIDTSEKTTFKPLVINDIKLPRKGEVALNNKGWSKTIMRSVENLEIEGPNLVRKILITGNCCHRLRSLKICKMKNLIEVNVASIKTLKLLEITDCRNLKRLSQIPDLSKLIELKTEKRSILEKVSGMPDFTTLKRLSINECPKVKELPDLARLSCLEEIEIVSCEKLQNIMLPTAVFKLSVQSCRDLQRVAVTGDLTNLTELHITDCPQLEELPILYRVFCLEQIKVYSCEKVENITLPTTIISLSARNCRDLQRLTVAGDLTKLTRLIIEECPELEELPSLGRVSCFSIFVIDRCEKLQSISGVEELHVSEYMRLCHCSNAVIRNSIHKLKSVPSEGMDMIGRAESTLNQYLSCVDGVIEIGTQETHLEWSELSAVIVCFVVIVGSSTSVRDINESLSNYYNYESDSASDQGLKMCQGEWMFTTVACDEQSYACLQKIGDDLRMYGKMRKGFRVAVKRDEEWRNVQVLCTIVDRLYY